MRTRRPRWLSLLLLALLGWAAVVVWLSQRMIAPARPRVSDSERPVLGAVLRDGRDGVLVERVVPPASTAGLRPGDRIVALDGQPVASAAAFYAAVESAGAGSTVRLDARRTDGGALLDVTLASRPVSPADLGLAYRDVSLPNPRGLVLRGWYLPPPAGGKAPALAFGHAEASDRQGGLPLALALHRHGFALLLLDFAGRGESDGEVITLGARESADLSAALDWLRAQPEVDGRRLALAGRGAGGAAALLCAAERPDVRAVASDGAFASLAEAADAALRARNIPPWLVRPALFAVAGFRASYRPGDVRPVEAAARTRARLLVAHGTRDAEVPFTDAERLVQAASGRATLCRLEGLGHNDPRPAEHVAAVAAFLEEAVR